MDEDVQLERASQQIIKLLLQEPEFLEEWQKNVSEELQDNDYLIAAGKSESSSSQCHVINSIETTVSDLASTIEFVISIFELNVDPRDCFVSENEQSNRNATQLYETGLKIEKLKNLDFGSAGKEAAGQNISTCCRRVNQVLKSFGKRFQSQQSLEMRVMCSFAARLCELFYTISEEIRRFSSSSSHENSNLNFSKNERKSVQKLSRKLAAASDEFNLKIVAVLEETKIYLEKEKKRKTTRPKPRAAIPVRPSSVVQNSNFGQPKMKMANNLQTKRRMRLVSSIQEAFRQVENDRKPSGIGNFSRKPTHAAGRMTASIAVPKQRSTYAKKPTKPTSPPITTNIDSDRNVLPKNDYDVMKSAIRMTGLVIDDMKQTMRIGNDEHIVLGVGK